MYRKLFIAFFLMAVVTSWSADLLYAPIALADNIQAIEMTSLDIGSPNVLFDGSAQTLARTANQNPAFVRVQFIKPVECRLIRVNMTDDEHVWSLAIADNLDDLKSKSNSYKLLVSNKIGGELLEAFIDEGVKIVAAEITVKRTTGDDYVHFFEWSFCNPTASESLILYRVTDRRNPDSETGRSAVQSDLTVPEDTVVWFKMYAVAGGKPYDVSDKVKWSIKGKTLTPFSDKNGFFHIKRPGASTLTGEYAGMKKSISINGTARSLNAPGEDIDVGLIERLPKYDYDAPNGGLPTTGQKITWRAHVFNWGKQPIQVKYEWSIDGKVVSVGNKKLNSSHASNKPNFIDLASNYKPKRHDLTLKVTPVKRMSEATTANNELTIQTDAVTVGFWVERSLWDYFREHQREVPPYDANSFHDWAQRMMRQWNKMFVEAKYPIFPQGITERVRMDKIVLVPDFALPLAGGLPSNNPDLRDKTVDMTWGMESNDVTPNAKLDANHWWSVEKARKAWDSGRIEQRKEDPPFWCGLGFIHELGHARYLIDTYGFNVHLGASEPMDKKSVQITDEGGPVVGRFFRADSDIIYSAKYPGQMGGDYWSYSVFEAMCWNRVQGKRARGGNCNSPSVIGEYLQDIPKKLIYEYADEQGNPLIGADVYVYRSVGDAKNWYGKRYENVVGVQGKTDGSGRVVFDRTMFAVDGKIIHTWGKANSVALVRISYGGRSYITFEEVADPNIAYFLGNKDEYVFKRRITLRDGEPNPSDWKPNQKWSAPGADFGVDGNH